MINKLWLPWEICKYQDIVNKNNRGANSKLHIFNQSELPVKVRQKLRLYKCQTKIHIIFSYQVLLFLISMLGCHYHCQAAGWLGQEQGGGGGGGGVSLPLPGCWLARSGARSYSILPERHQEYTAHV